MSALDPEVRRRMEEALDSAEADHENDLREIEERDGTAPDTDPEAAMLTAWVRALLAAYDAVVVEREELDRALNREIDVASGFASRAVRAEARLAEVGRVARRLRNRDVSAKIAADLILGLSQDHASTTCEAARGPVALAPSEADDDPLERGDDSWVHDSDMGAR